MRCLAATLLLAWLGTSLADLPVVVSAAPGKVAVTLYRDPSRYLYDAIDQEAPGSIALVVETRTVDLPPGQVVVRFEGVASGIVPQSAILFDSSPRERNQDSALLSRRGLVDAFTGQRVVLRRTDPATGKTVEEPATVRSAADRLVIQTSRGFEAVYCTGLNQTLVYPEAPAGLSAVPVLSMATRDQPGGTVTVTLAYLATGFDWDATYLGTLAPDGRSLALLGWLTMVSGDDTSFPAATLAAVAGEIRVSDETLAGSDTGERADSGLPGVSYGCWPAGTTSSGNFPDVPAPAMAIILEDFSLEEVVVSARQAKESMQDVPIAVTALSEGLGDLKLYRIPVPVDVMAHSQKQVAFLVKDAVPGELVYRARVYDDDPDPPEVIFRFQNRIQDGMGEALPAGNVLLFQNGSTGRMLVGETAIWNKALDEEVELSLAESTQVTIDIRTKNLSPHKREIRGTVRNANPFPVQFEMEFPTVSYFKFSRLPRKLVSKPGKRVWATRIPANDAVVLAYRVEEREEN